MSEQTAPLSSAGTGKRGDRIFRGMSGGSGIVVVLLVAFIAVFLLALAIPSLAHDKSSFLFSRVWAPSDVPPKFGVAALLWTTVLSSVIAMVIAVPVAIGVALFVTFYAPRKLGNAIASVVSLLAAVPSIIFGLWGITQFAPILRPVVNGLSSALGWFPLFRPPPGTDLGLVFVAGVVLAIMILPIVTAISREVFAQTPVAHREAALALGATRWEMIRLAVLPYGRSGVVSAAMLGLGRALGETVAVLIILSAPDPTGPFRLSMFFGGETFASKIASAASEFDSPTQTGAYIAAGLVLFIVTFAVNSLARIAVARSGPGRASLFSRLRRLARRRHDTELGERPARKQRTPRVSLGGRSGGRRVANIVSWGLTSLSFLLALVPLVWILYTVVHLGYRLLLTGSWWNESQRGITSFRTGGGAYHAIMGTLIQAGLCAVIAVPLALLAAVYLVEYGRGKKAARAVSFMVDILTGVPSIVAALFVYAVWVSTLGLHRVGFAVSLSLVLLMLPVVLRSTEEMLKLVPDELREASYALGVPKWKTITKVVIPSSISGIVTGVMLGLARVMGETAPLLILVGYAKGINLNPFSGFQGALPTMINQDRTESVQSAVDRTWGAALTLVLVVVVLTVLARVLARYSGVRASRAS